LALDVFTFSPEFLFVPVLLNRTVFCFFSRTPRILNLTPIEFSVGFFFFLVKSSLTLHRHRSRHSFRSSPRSVPYPADRKKTRGRHAFCLNLLFPLLDLSEPHFQLLFLIPRPSSNLLRGTKDLSRTFNLPQHCLRFFFHFLAPTTRPLFFFPLGSVPPPLPAVGNSRCDHLQTHLSITSSPPPHLNFSPLSA